MTTLLIIAVLPIANVLVVALFLWLGARLVKASRARYLRAVLASGAICVAGLLPLVGLAVLDRVFGPDNRIATLGMDGVLLIASLAANWAIITWLMGTTYVRAILVWLMGLVGTAGTLAFMFFVIRPFVFEGFIEPSNNMAPTVVGWHTTGVCPHCGGTVIIPAADPGDPRMHYRDEELGICTSCLKTATLPATKQAEAPDRFMVNKLLKPQRWDMIAFRYPPQPEVKYMKRLVGMPGETVYIKDSAVWINDAKAELPAELAHLQYTTPAGAPMVLLGTPDNPWRLGKDEYCVLGDFSERSADSRMWGPVPANNIEGVVSLCYWPPARWKVFK
jgi:signal peptidase I